VEFINLLKNQNLKKLYYASVNLNKTQIWLQLAELKRKRIFTTNKTFKELARLMVQIKEFEMAGKRKTGIRYSEYFYQFFSLISENSHTYEIFKHTFASMNLSLIKQMLP
jgi:hypothetical protein